MAMLYTNVTMFLFLLKCRLSTINFQLNFKCLPHFYELLLVVAGGLVVLPELVDVYVADGNDQDVAAVDHEKKNPFKKDDLGVV